MNCALRPWTVISDRATNLFPAERFLNALTSNEPLITVKNDSAFIDFISHNFSSPETFDGTSAEAVVHHLLLLTVRRADRTKYCRLGALDLDLESPKEGNHL